MWAAGIFATPDGPEIGLWVHRNSYIVLAAEVFQHLNVNWPSRSRAAEILKVEGTQHDKGI